MNSSHSTPSGTRTLSRLALAGVLIGVFDGMHPLFDQWAQREPDAIGKGLHGTRAVYVSDGKPVADDPARADRAVPASSYGRRCAARHVASYTAGQVAATVIATRALGFRLPAGALLAGAAINASTHLVIDRREPLLRLADKVGKLGYINHCTATRVDGKGKVFTELAGPGTALMELDQALHRAIGVSAAVLMAWLATRKEQRR